ncbi:[protein-PII] uridylyltransferase [Telmatospirillum sp. J64-1]|uniref:[protein-PII] uridylyltransferase n=1 Tax=Telmatospirillum sp. J64-1 TaxID=2502183 RepID=UPI00115CFEB5|nr:[protein-PII] uridylyltransferase [Telmatospirillum sp. J64-1]
MGHIRKQRAIIDRLAVIRKLNEVAAQDVPKHKRRGSILDILKEAHTGGFAEIRRRFEDQHGTGSQSVREHCFLIDQLVRIIHDFAVEHEFHQGVKTTGEFLSIVAVGGYGRAEMAPFSDIDLLFLLPYKRTPYSEQIVEYMLYMMWDMGLKVGHSTRSVDECIRQARSDLTIRTALLESRYLWGDKALYTELRRRFRDEVIAGSGVDFVEAKLAERDARHEKLTDSRYVLEPNIKEGKGGLRDLHTLYWMAKYLYQVDKVGDLVEQGIISQDAAQRFAKAQDWLWTVRCHLHYLAGRAEDRLTFDVQPEIGRRMNYTDHAGTRGVERFMKHYFLIAKDVGDLTRIFCAVLEEQQKRKPKLSLAALKFLRRSQIDGFRIDGNRLNVTEDTQFKKDPVALIRLFHTALEHDLDIHPHALSLVTQTLKQINNRLRQNEEANRLFMEMLTSRKDPEVALRHMNEAGVLGRFIPDFGRVVAQMQYDMYHVYTVDEHTIRAIGILHKIEEGLLRSEAPAASDVVGKVLSRRVLYLSVLLHDIAKGRGGDHSELGAEVALKLGPRLGLTDEETETVSWLVLHHLLMSNTAFKRDIDDPKTIADFVKVVQSPERLRLLLVLTVADIRAVGPNVWNGWKAGLLRELYYRAEDMMSGGMATDRREARVEKAQNLLRQRLEALKWDAKEIEEHLSRGYPSYWMSFDPDSLERHARMINEAERHRAPLTIDTRVDSGLCVTELTIYTGDHPGLFSQIAGAMAISGATIVDAKVVTMTNGMALDTFLIQDAEGGAFDSPSRLAKLSTTIERALSGRLRPAKELEGRKSSLPARAHVFKVSPRVLIDNKASTTHTVIELNGRDRPGLLHDVTAAMTRLGLQIGSAHISTYGERVVDVFYVKDIFGMKIEHENKLRQVREGLLAALADPADKRQRGSGAAAAAQ